MSSMFHTPGPRLEFLQQEADAKQAHAAKLSQLIGISRDYDTKEPVPRGTLKADISTLESLLSRINDGLQLLQQKLQPVLPGVEQDRCGASTIRVDESASDTRQSIQRLSLLAHTIESDISILTERLDL